MPGTVTTGPDAATLAADADTAGAWAAAGCPINHQAEAATLAIASTAEIVRSFGYFSNFFSWGFTAVDYRTITSGFKGGRSLRREWP